MKAAGTEVTIREFAAGDDAAFRRLNEEWISRYFTMEAKDEEALTDPGRRIVERGGRIFSRFVKARPWAAAL
jgi:putative acetyltransferase